MIDRLPAREREYLQDRCERGGTHGLPMLQLQLLNAAYDAACVYEDTLRELRERIEHDHAGACHGDDPDCRPCTLVERINAALGDRR